MMRRLLRNRRGAAAAELVLALPVFTLLVWGFVSVGRLYWANAGLAHGLGEGARVATLWPRRTNAEITSAVVSRAYGLDRTLLADPVITPGTLADGRAFVDIAVTYNYTFNILGVSLPPVTLRHSRRAYRP